MAGAYAQIEHELDVIEALDFPGYFLIVHDLVEFCRDNEILCQGRGSAANSAVCYAIGVTAVDPVAFGSSSNASSPPSATTRRTSTSTSSPTGGRR